MTRTGLFGRFGRENGTSPAPPAPAAEAPPRPRRPLPNPGQLRRERRVFLHAREQGLRDLGGLMLEMYRRDQFRQDLLLERCLGLVELEDRLGELDALLTASTSVRRARAARCECGAPILYGSQFCAACGKAVDG